MNDTVWGVKRSTIDYVGAEFGALSSETKRIKLDSYVSQALTGFEFIEEGIKAYFDHCFAIIRQRTRGMVSFSYAYEDVKESPLAALLPLFKKYCSNYQLIDKLSVIKHERDFLSNSKEFKREPWDENRLSRSLERAIIVSDQVATIYSELSEELMRMQNLRAMVCRTGRSRERPRRVRPDKPEGQSRMHGLVESANRN